MALRFTLRQLSVFIAVAESGSTIGAGKILSISQSAVSSALSELESAVNERLFDRHGKRLILNDTGRTLHLSANTLVKSAEAIAQDFESTPPSLRIAASNTIGNYVLPGILAQFLAQYPGARLDLVVGNTREVIEAVNQFKADIGLIEGDSYDPHLRITPWIDDEMIIVTSAQNLIAYQKNWPDLAHADWIVREPGSGTREIFEQQVGRKLGKLNITLELGSSEAIRRTLLSGYGVSCLSRHIVADDIKNGQLKMIGHNAPIVRRFFSTVIHHDKAPTRSLSAFHAFLEQHARIDSFKEGK
ncbi:MAG: LysR family transcriptional regulator [Proteobacteria bacterium]|nr:LysR family transcriptional regulator [Pseudomonadota bacterium]MDE3207448.1 LysR family transcriptional regulator [Pseudomonadota bacterium]